MSDGCHASTASPSPRRCAPGRGWRPSPSAARPGRSRSCTASWSRRSAGSARHRFLHALNYCMLLPGPEAQQLAVYIGWLLHRTKGGLVAGTLFVLPGFLAIMALSLVYAAFGRVGIVQALFFGLKAAVLAIVLEAVRPDRQARAQEPGHGRDRGRRVRRDLLPRRAVPAHHPRRRPDRLSGRARRAPGLSRRRRARARGGQGRRRRRDGARRGAAGACPAAALLVAARWRRSVSLLWLGPVVLLLLTLGAEQRLQRDRRVLLEDGGGDLRRRLRGAGLRRPGRRSRPTAGSSPARCSTASAWPRRRRGR